MISEKSKNIIKQFLAEFWHELGWQASQTVAGAELPHQTPEQLYNQLLGQDLQFLAAAAEGLLAEEHREEVQDVVQRVCEWMWARPQMPAFYSIPAEWWGTEFGNLVLRAHMWAVGDELVTITQASEMTGRSLPELSQIIRRGRLTAYRDPEERNPTKATRLSRRQVEALPKKRKLKPSDA